MRNNQERKWVQECVGRRTKPDGSNALMKELASEGPKSYNDIM